MSIDYRALCAQLADELERCRPLAEVPDCLQRARAALAAEADGPAVPEGREPASVVREPSDEELLGISVQVIEPYDNISLGEYEAENNCAIEVYGSELIAFARAVLARYGHQPVPPDEGEVAELVEWMRSQATVHEVAQTQWAKRFIRAADLLEQRHPTPVPVSERLPGPGDCDAEGQVWVSYKPAEWKHSTYWELMPMDKAMKWAPVDSWLPATALPLPAGEVQP